jgi:hypothetical protein
MTDFFFSFRICTSLTGTCDISERPDRDLSSPTRWPDFQEKVYTAMSFPFKLVSSDQKSILSFVESQFQLDKCQFDTALVESRFGGLMFALHSTEDCGVLISGKIGKNWLFQDLSSDNCALS